MSKKRNRNSRSVNTAYLDAVIREQYNFSKSQFSISADVSYGTVRNALAGKRIDSDTCEKMAMAPGIERDKLFQLEDSVDGQEQNSETDADRGESSAEQSPEAELNSSVSTATPLEPRQFHRVVASDSLTTVISVLSVKGGVGKTLISLNLAAELAQHLRVAVVDVDLFTFGLTRKLAPLIEEPQATATFVDLTMSSASQARRPATIQFQRYSNSGDSELTFVPAYVSEVSGRDTLIAPTLFDWSLAEAHDAISNTLDVLLGMDFDVIIFDSHPGLVTLTQAVSFQAHCNIVVSDYDLSTLQANWLFIWELQKRHRKHSSVLPEWEMAMNRVASMQVRETSTDYLLKSHALASSDWKQLHPDNETPREPHPVQPAFLLNDVDILRNTRPEHEKPFSVLQLGGNNAVLATRRLIRRLVERGICTRWEDSFIYAQRSNQEANVALSRVPDVLYTPSGLERSRRRGLMTLLPVASFGMFLLLLLQTKFPDRFGGTGGIATLLLVAPQFVLGCYAVGWLFREAMHQCESMQCFYAASAIANLPADERCSQYDEGAVAINNGSRILHCAWAVAFLPSFVYAADASFGLSASWRAAMFGASFIAFGCGSWPLKGVGDLIAVFLQGIPYLVEKKHH